MDPEKVKVILECPEPMIVIDVRRFHGISIFYKNLMRGFSQICAPLTMYMKKGQFKWIESSGRAFEKLKGKVTKRSILSVPYFEKVFQVDFHTSGLAIEAEYSPKGWPIAFLSEKLKDIKD